jgi:hypothetical protein
VTRINARTVPELLCEVTDEPSYSPFAFGTGTMTWPSLKTTLSTEANSGSARTASATPNEGSRFHVEPLLTSDSGRVCGGDIVPHCTVLMLYQEDNRGTEPWTTIRTLRKSGKP